MLKIKTDSLGYDDLEIVLGDFGLNSIWFNSVSDYNEYVDKKLEFDIHRFYVQILGRILCITDEEQFTYDGGMIITGITVDRLSIWDSFVKNGKESNYSLIYDHFVDYVLEQQKKSIYKDDKWEVLKFEVPFFILLLYIHC